MVGRVVVSHHRVDLKGARITIVAGIAPVLPPGTNGIQPDLADEHHEQGHANEEEPMQATLSLMLERRRMFRKLI